MKNINHEKHQKKEYLFWPVLGLFGVGVFSLFYWCFLCFLLCKKQSKKQ